ncbi:alpha-L-rhamnosidase-related protein [Sediminibacterium sp.]|uniref:alpha-L-rhamnosidase-related protein n=1 Tax=Sediminibacterium sp. TaxID=1917865 RepID=UPI003F72EB9D
MRKLDQLIVLIALVFSKGILYGQGNANNSIVPHFKYAPSLKGKPVFLGTPFNTAGDKLYLIGHQDGSFPDLGWHVKDEMGGIWHHPIKLMDGFEASIQVGAKKYMFDKATDFVNYPFGNKHIYTVGSTPLSIERYQFVPDQLPGVQIEYAIKNSSNQTIQIQFHFEAVSNLMPVWLGERTGMVNSKDLASYDPPNNRWMVKDSLNPWYVIYGTTVKGDASQMIYSKKNKPNTTITNTTYKIEIKPNSIFYLPFTIAGSAISKEQAILHYTQLNNTAAQLLTIKKKRVLNLNNFARLTLNDHAITTSFEWLKYNSDWLTLDVDGIGRGVVAGLPDYPWWFGGDMAYTLKGLIALGRKDLVYSSIDLIHRISEKTNGNGRIVHEVSTNGAVFNPGNVNETPQFISLIWEVFCWTGDREFLLKYLPSVVKGLNWVLTENDADKNLLPDGAGMMEIHGLTSEMIDVAAYTQKAFADAAKMAWYLKQDSLARDYQQKADLLKEKINSQFWVEKNQSYADFIATKSQALHLIEDAIVRADTLGNKWAVAALKQMQSQTIADTATNNKGFVMHHNWVVNTPLETGIAEKDQAIKALNTAKRFSNGFGMYVTGIDKNEKRDLQEYSYAASVGKNDFTYTGTVMTLPTAVQIIAENNYRRPNEAFNLLKRVDKTFGYALPGSMYEVSPDYGMMTQAWNVYAYGEPIVKQFFGIQPQAYNKQLKLSPSLPTALTYGKLDNVIMGENSVSVDFKKTSNAITFTVKQTANDWDILFEQPAGKYKVWKLNGKLIQPEKIGSVARIKIGSKNAHISLSN